MSTRGKSKCDIDDDSLRAIKMRDATWRPPRGGMTNSGRAAGDRRILLALVRELEATISRLL